MPELRVCAGRSTAARSFDLSECVHVHLGWCMCAQHGRPYTCVRAAVRPRSEACSLAQQVRGQQVRGQQVRGLSSPSPFLHVPCSSATPTREPGALRGGGLTMATSGCT